MNTVIRIGLCVAAAALGIWLWTIFFPGAEKVIQRKVASLAGTATISTSDSNLTRAAKAATVVDYFTTDAVVVIDIPEFGSRTFTGHEEIRETALTGFAGVRSLNVQFLDVSVRLGPDKQTADVSCTAKVSAGNSKDFGVQELHLQFKKVDGSWLICRVETVKTLS